jgi:hypothetical protein
MQHPDLGRSLHAHRMREARRRDIDARRALEARGRRPRRSLRQAVGRTVVRIGRAIEADPRQPIASS